MGVGIVIIIIIIIVKIRFVSLSFKKFCGRSNLLIFKS